MTKDEGVKALMRWLQAQQRSYTEDVAWGKECYEFILEFADKALEFPSLPDEEREALNLGKLNLKRGLARINSDDPDQVRIAAYDLMWGAFIIGSRAVVSDAVKKYIDNEHAQKMRDERANAPKEKALFEAIVAERGDGPVEHPSKEAGAILKIVNTRLESDGFPPVKVDVVRRRLEKFPRS